MATSVEREAVTGITPGLLAGDLVVVTGLVVLGSITHGVSPVGQPVETASNVLPFVTGWLVTATLLGSMNESTVSDPLRALRVAAGTWLGAANVGLLLRVGVVGETAVWPFPLVMTGLGVVVTAAWRVVATRLF